MKKVQSLKRLLSLHFLEMLIFCCVFKQKKKKKKVNILLTLLESYQLNLFCSGLIIGSHDFFLFQEISTIYFSE